MPGKRQPTDVIKANGRKHLSRAEEAQRRAGEVKLPQAKTARPPRWLPEELKKTFRALGKQLIQAKLYTELDADTLGRYVAAQHQWELATGHAEEALEAAGYKLTSAELSRIPQNTVSPDPALYESIDRLLDMLEENDDIQNVYHNAEMQEEE